MQRFGGAQGSCREGLRKEQAAERAALDRLFDRDTARSRSKEVDGAYTCRLTMEVWSLVQ